MNSDETKAEIEATTGDALNQPVAETPEPVVAEPIEQKPATSDTGIDTPRPWKKIILISLAVLFVASAASAAYWKYGRPTKPAPAAVVTVQPVAKPAAAPTTLDKFATPTTGETWLATAKKLPAQKFFRENDADAAYYEVGKRGDAMIIMSVVQQVGDFIVLYEKSPDGKVTAIIHPDGQGTYNADNDKFYDTLFTSKVALDTTTHYDSLSMPAQLPLDKGYVVKRPATPQLGSYVGAAATNQPATTDTVVTKFGGSSLIRRETKYADTHLTSIAYLLLTPLHTQYALGFEPVETNLTQFSWERGSSPDDTISAITRGCSLSGTSASRGDAVTDADVQTVGKSPSGIQIYELKSLQHPLMTKAYQEFKDFYGTDTTNPYQNISLADFAKEHAVVLIKDNYGQWLVYARDKMRPQGGCAKPVIYLYPQTAEQVSVKVGAQVKVSEPSYDAKQGWNVWATPVGKLTVAGRVYDSLFWEGPGLGMYPGITAGAVVPQKQAASTIRRQLAEQGLVGHEIDDFMTYWEPKLPNTPYVRLTWFNTQQMNNLAPLAISPKPTTVIRVFLDFDGLDQPISLPAQHFTAPERRGFTVVEWGGLANFPLK